MLLSAVASRCTPTTAQRAPARARHSRSGAGDSGAALAARGNSSSSSSTASTDRRAASATSTRSTHSHVRTAQRHSTGVSIDAVDEHDIDVDDDDAGDASELDQAVAFRLALSRAAMASSSASSASSASSSVSSSSSSASASATTNPVHELMMHFVPRVFPDTAAIGVNGVTAMLGDNGAATSSLFRSIVSGERAHGASVFSQGFVPPASAAAAAAAAGAAAASTSATTVPSSTVHAARAHTVSPSPLDRVTTPTSATPSLATATATKPTATTSTAAKSTATKSTATKATAAKAARVPSKKAARLRTAVACDTPTKALSKFLARTTLAVSDAEVTLLDTVSHHATTFRFDELGSACLVSDKATRTRFWYLFRLPGDNCDVPMQVPLTLENAGKLTEQLQRLPRFLHESFSVAIAEPMPKGAPQSWHVCFQSWLPDMPIPYSRRPKPDAEPAVEVAPKAEDVNV